MTIPIKHIENLRFSTYEKHGEAPKPYYVYIRNIASTPEATLICHGRHKSPATFELIWKGEAEDDVDALIKARKAHGSLRV